MESKDSQNPYRTGVLIANHVEGKFSLKTSVLFMFAYLDRFGEDLKKIEVKHTIPKTEMRGSYNPGSTMYYEGRENFAQKAVTEDEIENEEGYKEYEKAVTNNKAGQPSHILFGHGPTQDVFEKRDFGTTNNLFYEKKMKTETLINPHYYHEKKENRDFFVTNAKPEDVPTLFAPAKDKTFHRVTQKF